MGKTADYFAEIVIRRATGLIGSRKIIAISGPPAAGKSTVAEAVVASLTAMEKTATLVPMDGFHLDNAVLERAGTVARKAALRRSLRMGLCISFRGSQTAQKQFTHQFLLGPAISPLLGLN